MSVLNAFDACCSRIFLSSVHAVDRSFTHAKSLCFGSMRTRRFEARGRRVGNPLGSRRWVVGQEVLGGRGPVVRLVPVPPSFLGLRLSTHTTWPESPTWVS